MKKTVLGKGADALFEITTEDEQKVESLLSSKLPKFKTYEKLTILLKAFNLEYLDKLEKKIMRNRSSKNKKERITKNSILRCILDVISKLPIDTSEIPDERELLKRIELAVNKTAEAQRINKRKY